MKRICPKNSCTGCGMCSDVCNHHAISMVMNDNGFMYPQINDVACIDCGLCKLKCPSNNIVEGFNIPEPFAAWTNDKLLRNASSSGGVFAQIAVSFLEEGNSFVVGASVDSDGRIKHVLIDSSDQINKLQGTKYIQSEASGIYALVLEKLKLNLRVLFSGTPCQIAGIRSFIPHSYQDKLFTVDVVCHGVPSAYISELAIRLNKAEGIYSYRTKSDENLHSQRMTYRLSNGELNEIRRIKDDFFYRAFLGDTSLRMSCYACHYARLPRISDISLADFWNKTEIKTIEMQDRKKGISLVLVNSEKGRFLFNNSNLTIVPVKWKDCLPWNPNIIKSNKAYRLVSLSNKIFLIRRLPIYIQKNIFQTMMTRNPFFIPWAIIVKLGKLIEKRKTRVMISEFINKYD